MKVTVYVLTGILSLFLGGCLFDGDSDHHEEKHDHSTHSETSLSIIPDTLNPAPVAKADLMVRGQTIFSQLCAQCHLDEGQGVSGSVPPIANSDYLMEDRERSIEVLLEGRTGEMMVNGEMYDGSMPAIEGSDNDIAAVLTYVRNQYNGATDSIAVSEVTAARGHGDHDH